MQSTNRQQLERSLSRIDKNTEEVYHPSVTVVVTDAYTYSCHDGHIYKIVCMAKGSIDATKTVWNLKERSGPGIDVQTMNTGSVLLNAQDELLVRCLEITGKGDGAILICYATPGTKITTT
jgi:F420-0:gamma-glutamyl ligase